MAEPSPLLTEAELKQIEELYDSACERLRRFAFSLPTRPGFSPDRDLVMTAFTEVIKNWGMIKNAQTGKTIGEWDLKHQVAYLEEVCRKLRANEFREWARLTKALPLIVDWLGVGADDPPEAAIGRGALEECKRAIGDMPYMQRTVATMVWLLLMPRPEVAAALGISLAAIRVHLCNALKILRERVGPHLPFPLTEPPLHGRSDEQDEEGGKND